MSTSATLLALLEQEPAYGYTLKQRYDECFGHARRVAFGQVYAALSSFDRHGYAEVTGVDSDGGPKRKRYRITAEGSTVVERWIASPEPATSYSSSALFAKVSIALMSGRSAHDVLTTQREAHLQRMRVLTKRRRAAHTAELLATTFELNHLDADLKWIEEAGRRLADLGREVRHA
jgi:DNA-binding PadR family transcriptional regulator